VVQYNFKTYLPPGTELPDSDDIPVDNEEQNLLPNILLFVLNFIWAERKDWYFGVDMGVYHTTGANPRSPVVPDAFLSLGVPRFRDRQTRRSYVVWEEEDTPPILTLEVVSWSPGNEYDKKLETYRKLGVLYYVIYNPQYWKRDGHQPFEVYKLIEGTYRLQLGEPVWMPEIGLGMGRYPSEIGDQPQEMLGWFDLQGERISTPEERAKQFKNETEDLQEETKRLRKETEKFQSQAEKLAARLRELGEDPELL
jgi:Uma2 family endonuclease